MKCLGQGLPATLERDFSQWRAGAERQMGPQIERLVGVKSEPCMPGGQTSSGQPTRVSAEYASGRYESRIHTQPSGASSRRRTLQPQEGQQSYGMETSRDDRLYAQYQEQTYNEMEQTLRRKDQVQGYDPY